MSYHPAQIKTATIDLESYFYIALG